MQDEGVIGDDDVGLARGALGALDEAAPVVRAGGIDAFAAPVGEAEALRRHLAARRLDRPRDSRLSSQAGKSPPTMSPSRL